MKVNITTIKNMEEATITADIASIFYFYSNKDTWRNKERILIAKVDEEIVGMVLFNKNKSKILLLVVKDKYRGKSIGKALFEEGIKKFKIKEMEIKATLFPTNSTLFWEKMKFKRVGEPIITKKGSKMLLMVWRGKDE